MNATAYWAQSAPRPNYTLWSALAVEGDGLVMLRANNTLYVSKVEEALRELQEAAKPINVTNLGEVKRFLSSYGYNGTQYAVGGSWLVLPAGNKSWTGLNASRPYAVYAWLDVPRRPEPLKWCVDYSQLADIAKQLAINATIGNASAAEWMKKMAEAECKFYNQIMPWFRIYAGPQPFWRLLTADVRTAVVYNNATLLSETRTGVVGVWAWLVGPTREDYRGGNVTVRKGVLVYDPGWNSTVYIRPILNRTASNFTLLLGKAPSPTLGKTYEFYKWKETCTWCCQYTCDANGNCWCSKDCSATRDVWEEPKWSKVTRNNATKVPVLHYLRPWVPENRTDYKVVVNYIYRDWDVQYETKYGSWSGDGEPPPDASCWTHDREPYKRVKLWDVGAVSNYAYGFAWLSQIALAVDDKRVPLTDYYDGAPSTDADGVPVVNLLRGSEHDQYCSVDIEALPEPNWRLVPLAVSNLTYVNREAFFYLLASGNYSRAYMERVVKRFTPADNPFEPFGSLHNQLYDYYYNLIRTRPFFPMPEAEPVNYTAYNFYVACIRFDWRSEKDAYGVLTLWPGNSTWLMQYPIGDSPSTRHFVTTLAERWKWTLSHPPPPPPALLMAEWEVPWNNWTALPYTPAKTKPMPPADPRWGTSVWNSGLALLNPFAWGELWGRLFTALFISAFTAAVVLEVLAVVLGFPSIGQFLAALAVHVVQDIAFWFNIRLFIKSKWLTYFYGVVKSPVKRAAARVARRFAHRAAVRRRRRDLAREIAEGKASAEAIRQQLKRRVEEAVLARLRTAGVIMDEAGWAVKEVAEGVKEAAKEAYRIAREIKAITDGDVIHFAREILKRAAPRVEAKFNEFFDRLLMHPVGRWLYYAVLWRMDDKAIWRAYLNPAALREMYLRGKITREEFQQLLAIREYLLGRRAYLRARALREAVDEERVAEKVRELERRMLATSRGAYLALIRDLALTDWRELVERRAEELARSGVQREEALLTAVREAVERVEARVKAVYEPVLQMHLGAFDRLTRILREYLGREFNSPRELAEALVGIRLEGDRLVEDNSARVLLLAHAHRIWAAWEEHWFSRPLPYDPRKYAVATALDEIAVRLPTLRVVATARAVALGAVRPEEAERALGLRLRRVEPTLGVEEVAGRYSQFNRAERPAPYVPKDSLVKSLAALRTEIELERLAAEEVFRSAISPMAAEAWAYKLLEKAIRAAKEGDERAKKEVLQKSFEYFREFGISFAWLPKLERIYAVELPEAAEAVRAFEAALKRALEGDREGAVKQLREELSRLKEFYRERGGVSAVKTIVRLEGEMVKALEAARPDLMKRVVERQAEAAEKAALLRRAWEALRSKGAEEAVKIVAEGREAEARASLILRTVAEKAREEASLIKSLREEAAAVERKFAEVHKQYAALIQLVDRYLSAEGANAALEALKAYSANAAAEAKRLRAEALGLEAEGYVYTPKFLVVLAKALPELEGLRAAPREERLRRAGELGEELRRALARGSVKAEVWLPDPLLYAVAVKYKELVEEYKAAKASGDVERIKAVEKRLEALKALITDKREFGAVLKAVMEGREPQVRIRFELPEAELAVRAWELAQRAAAAGKGLRAPELEPLRKYEKSLAGYREELERVVSLVREAEEAWRRGDAERAASLLKEARAAVAKLNKAEREVNAPLTRLEAPASLADYEAAWALIRLEALAPILFTEAERQALARVLQGLKAKEYAERLRREYAYFTPVKVIDREVEVPLFKQPAVPGEVFSRALAVVLLGELAARDRQIAEYAGQRIRGIFHSYYTEALQRGVKPEEAKRLWAQALREAREALRPPLAKLRPGEADVHLLRGVAEAVLEAAGRINLNTEAVRAALQIREKAEVVVKYFRLLEGPRREEELKRLYEEAPLAISYLLRAGAKAGEEAAVLVKKFVEELSAASPKAVEELKALVGEGAEHLLRLASISREAAVAAEAIAAVKAVVPKKAFRDVQKLKEAVREAIKAFESYSALADFLRSPSLAADLARLRRAAGGDRELLRLINAVAAVKTAYEVHGKVRLVNQLYESLLPYLGWEREKMLLRAPIDVHVLNRMGAKLARAAYTRFPFFEMYGDALRDAAVLADVPLKVGMPVNVKLREYFLIGFPEETYQDKVAKYVKRWDWAGVAEGIRKYYRTEEGRAHRELAMLLALSARVIAMERAAEALEGKAPRAVITAIKARAAWEEARLYSIANRLTKYNFETDAPQRYGQLLKELRALLSDPKAAAELRPFYGKLPPDPEEAAYRLVKWTTPERALRWALEMRLEEADLLAKAVEAFRTYRRIEKWLSERRTVLVRGREALAAAKALDLPVEYTPSRVEEAVARNIRKWAEGAYRRLEKVVIEELGVKLAALGGELPAPLAQWLAEQGFFQAKISREEGDREALKKLKEEVRRLAGEFKAVAQFSQGAKSEALAVLKEWSEAGGLKRYVAVVAMQEVSRAEPARAPDAKLFNALPEELRRAVERELARAERALLRAMIREGYYDSILRPVFNALGLEFERRSPAAVAKAIARRVEKLDAPEEVKAAAVKALKELASTKLDDPLLYEKAVRAGEAVMDVLAVIAGRRLEDLALRDRYAAEQLLKAAEEAVNDLLRGFKAKESLALDVAYRLVGRDSERAAAQYVKALRQGDLPIPEGAALVFYTEDEETAKLMAKRFRLRASDYPIIYGNREEPGAVYFFYHPALEDAVAELEKYVMRKCGDPCSFTGPLGFAPAEFIYAVKGVRSGRLEGHPTAWTENWEFTLERLKLLATTERWKDVNELLGRVSHYGLHYLLYNTLDEYREFAEAYGKEWRETLETYLASQAITYYLRYALSEGRIPDLTSLPSTAALHALSTMSGIDVFSRLAAVNKQRGRGITAAKGLPGASEAMGYVSEWVKFILKERMAPLPKKSPYLELAAWLVATARGRPYQEVLGEALEEIRRTGVPPGFKMEDEEWWTGAGRREEAEEQVKRPPEERRAEKARRAGQTAEGATAAGAEMTAGAVKPAVEKKAVAEKATGGLIPPGYSGISAASWLGGREGRIQLDRQAAEALRKRVSKAIDKVKAKYLHKLYKLGGEALVEIAEAAAGDALNLVFNAIDSPGALRYIALLLDAAEEVLFEGGGGGSGDANALYGWLKGHLERAEEFGASWEVWQFVRSAVKAAAEAALSYYEDALRGIATVENALASAAVSAAGLAGYAALHDGLYSTAVVSATAAAVILAREGAFERAVEYVKKAAEAAYEAAREIFEKAKVTLQRLYELFVEAVARVLDYIKAHWFILAAAAAGLIAWAVAQQLDYTLWQNHVALNAGAIAGLAKAADVGEKWKEVRDAILTRTVTEKEIVERIAQLGLDKGVVERAMSAFSALRHTVAKEQIENAVLELQLLASYVQAMKTAIYKMALEEASRAWYEERDPAALWALAMLGAKETGKGSNKIFKDEDDKLAYLIASFTLLSHLKEFVELKERIYRELWALERAVKNGEFTLGEIWGHFEILAEAERKAGEVANKLNSIAYELETIGLSEIAEQLRVTIEKVIELVEASERELVTIKATRGERAVATLLSLVNGGLIGATIERALSVRGKHVVGALSVASAVRSAPYGFYLYFLTSGNREELSETRRIALRIVSLLSDPLVREMLNWRQDIKIRSEEKVEEDKRHVYVTFVDREGHILLKVIWEISRKIRPLKVEGEIVDIFREVANSVDAILSGSKPLVKLSEEGKKAWERATTAVREVKRVIKGMAKIITIGVLPTDASLRIGYKSTGGESSSLSQAFTYYAMTDGKVSVEKIYPSEEGLKAKWYVVGRYEEVVNKILDEGYKSLKSLSNKMPDPDLLFSDINISKEFKRTLTDAAGEFRHRVTMLLNEWDKAKELKDVKTLNKLGKYLRVLLPLAYLVDAYRQGELSSEEVALAIIFAVLYDGTIYRNEIWFSVGDPEQEENPIISREHFTVFWLWALKELGFRPSAVHFGYEAHIIVFRNNELYNLLKALNPALPKLYELRNTLAEFAEAFRVVSRELVKNRFSINWAYEVKEESFFKKLERVIAMVENYTSANQNNRK